MVSCNVATLEKASHFDKKDDYWASSPAERANELTKFFLSESQLPETVENEYKEFDLATIIKMLKWLAALGFRYARDFHKTRRHIGHQRGLVTSTCT